MMVVIIKVGGLRHLYYLQPSYYSIENIVEEEEGKNI